MNAPIKIDLTPINLTAELQKVALQRTLSADQNADLRTLILDAAGAIGLDGQGRDGLLGYLKFAASTYPKQYLALLAKVLPLQIDSNSTVNVIEHVNIVSVPPDRYMPADNFKGATIDLTRIPSPELKNEDPDSIRTIEDVLKNPTPVDPFAEPSPGQSDEIPSG